MHILANEPSLAYYRLQENIRKSLPSMIDKRFEAEKMQQDLQGSIYDLEYAIGWEFHFQCPISCVYVSLRNFDQKFKTSHFFRRYHEKFITVWKLVDISIIFSFSILQKCWFLFLKICSTVFCRMNSQQTVIQISDNFAIPWYLSQHLFQKCSNEFESIGAQLGCQFDSPWNSLFSPLNLILNENLNILEYIFFIIVSRELNTIVGTQDTFKNILEMSKTALFLKQQVKYLQTKR